MYTLTQRQERPEIPPPECDPPTPPSPGPALLPTSPTRDLEADPSSFLLEAKKIRKGFFSFFFFLLEGGHCQCRVTDAKVMTFTAAKCGHNLPQTSRLLGKLISTK